MTVLAHKLADGGSAAGIRRARSLADMPAAFCASLDALAYARRMGLRPDARILTTSPALIFSGDPAVECIEDRISPEKRFAYARSILLLSLDVWKAVAADPLCAEIALVAAQEVTITFAKYVQRAMLLLDDDFAEPRAVIAFETGSPDKDARFNTPWEKLLGDNADLLPFSAPETEVRNEATFGVSDPGLAVRTRFWSLGQIVSRLAVLFWRRLPKSYSRGTYLLARQNPFADQAAAQLASRGYALGRLEISRPTGVVQPDAPATRRAIDIVGPLLSRYLSAWVVPSAVPGLIRLYENHLATAIGQFQASKAAWRVEVRNPRHGRVKGILTNMLVGPHFIALHRAARELGVPVICFQHGHSRELTTEDRCFLASLEEAACDLMICFDKHAATVTERNPFCVAKAIGIGAASDYFKARRYRSRDETRPWLFYVSTALYSSHIQIGEFGWSDAERARREIDVIENVLARLPHRVFYKSYPERRYVDPDPMMVAARKAKNVDVLETDVDLRYLMPDARLLITARASSTLGWCLIPDLPMVYVEYPDQIPLNEAIRPYMERAVFLFDAGKPDWQTELRDFLSRPIEDIEAEWEKRRAARAELVERFFATGGPGAGRRAADAIMKFVEATR